MKNIVVTNKGKVLNLAIDTGVVVGTAQSGNFKIAETSKFETITVDGQPYGLMLMLTQKAPK